MSSRNYSQKIDMALGERIVVINDSKKPKSYSEKKCKNCGESPMVIGNFVYDHCTGTDVCRAGFKGQIEAFLAEEKKKKIQSINDLKGRNKELKDEIKGLDSQVGELIAENRDLKEDIKELNYQKDDLRAENRDLKDQIWRLRDRIAFLESGERSPGRERGGRKRERSLERDRFGRKQERSRSRSPRNPQPFKRYFEAYPNDAIPDDGFIPLNTSVQQDPHYQRTMEYLMSILGNKETK